MPRSQHPPAHRHLAMFQTQLQLQAGYNQLDGGSGVMLEKHGDDVLTNLRSCVELEFRVLGSHGPCLR